MAAQFDPQNVGDAREGERLRRRSGDSVRHPAMYPHLGIWLGCAIATIGFFAAIYGYAHYKVAMATETASLQAAAAGPATTPSPPISTTGQGSTQ